MEYRWVYFLLYIFTTAYYNNNKVHSLTFFFILKLFISTATRGDRFSTPTWSTTNQITPACVLTFTSPVHYLYNNLSASYGFPFYTFITSKIDEHYTLALLKTPSIILRKSIHLLINVAPSRSPYMAPSERLPNKCPFFFPLHLLV